MRVRTLGFHTRRPDPHPRPRAGLGTGRDTVADRVRALDLGAPVSWVRHCVSRRTVVLAGLADGRHLVLKWPDDDLDPAGSREADMLSLLWSTPMTAEARTALPSAVPVTGGGQITAYDALHPAASLRELLDTGALRTGHVDTLATALAGLHTARWTADVLTDPDLRMSAPAPRTTLLSVAEYACGVGAEFDTWIRAVQRLSDAFGELHRGWDPRGLIHFDLRDDNVLFTTGTTASTAVRIIDWEFAAVGDPHYDVGYVVAQFVLHALRSSGRPSIPAATLHTIDRLVTVYHSQAPAPGAALLKTVRYAGLVLLQQAGARLELFGSLGRTGHLSLLLAEGLLRRPQTLLNRLSPQGAP
ncbi:aminoglycoside phosphotransferase family protein [Streptomyces sp. S.PNR 29]|uniref:phosphotransferase family protein n=1 Tax=Streptomyces sp. S.PNR 29 TaxID=2973805 RepID=UPI0025B07C5B|nr:aminoglycoside phosphotransferase family protein [Streptomyces sp. S.PNR 29]MDN0195304.1 aminoglycoside phosphotransferase family protein [Streptomyces sp. S.PNR 29]